MRACVGRPDDQPALEPVVTTVAFPRGRLVASGVAQETAFPSEVGPLVADGPVDLVGRRPGRPIDRATLEMLVVTDVIRGDIFGGRRLSQKSVRPSQSPVLITDRRQNHTLFKTFQLEPARLGYLSHGGTASPRASAD